MLDFTLDGIRRLVAGAVPEGLHLEYKRKQDASAPGLSRDDARAVAEAVSTFANSDGGVLVLGVRSERREGADVAAGLVPMTGVDRLSAEVLAVAELNVGPAVRGVVVEAIRMDDGSDAGLVAVRVPPSDLRPHMSTARNVHRYYRRGFSGSEIMTPGQVRDQILAVREAVLEPIVTASPGGAFSRYPDFAAVQASLQVRLRNVGARLCRDPFLRVSGVCRLDSHSVPFDGRLGAWKPDYAPGLMIHVGDESPVLSLRYLARVDAEVFARPDGLDPEALLGAVAALPFDDQHSKAAYLAPALDAIGLRVAWGADNETARSATFVVPTRELAIAVLTGASDVLRGMFQAEVGAWRDDVFSSLPPAAALRPVDEAG